MGDAFYRRLAGHTGLPYLSPPELAARAVPWLTSATARAFGVVPLGDGTAGLVAAAHPSRIDIDGLSAVAGRPISLAVAAPDAISTELDRLFPDPATPPPDESVAVPATSAERQRAERLAGHAGLEFVDLDAVSGATVDEAAAHLLSHHACSALQLLPVADDGHLLVVASSPLTTADRAVVSALTGRPVRAAIGAPADIAGAIARVFGPAPAPAPAVDGPRPQLGQLLLTTGLISEATLATALALQERSGERLGTVLVYMGAVDEAELTRTLAGQLALPDLDVSHFEPDPLVLRVVPEAVARRHRFAPLGIRDHVLYLALSDPLDRNAIAALREHTDLPIRIVAAPRSSIEQLLQRTYKEKYIEVATVDLLNRRPEESAYWRLSPRQRVALIAILVTAGLLFGYAPVAMAIAFNVLSILFYTSFSIYKFSLIGRALQHDLELPVTEEDVRSLEPWTLPIYTILVPLYREAAVVGKLVQAIAHLDYPAAKLDVKLLVEENDDETLGALHELVLPPHFRLVVVPDSQPKTKPKACNYGLIHAEGQYVVIYDAEDRPEPDQLKKIVFAFAHAEERIVCIQCKLNYFNRTQNVLTRWFTAEYSHWFDLLMPGLDAADAPIPLGGTSNHFRTERLVELGAWDPYNVTEDADLGVRLHKAGYKTAIIDSTTLEEANSDLYNWIRQRSRWVKGYIQTWLVHMRHPIEMYRQVGWRSWWSFQFIIGGTFLSFLLNPLYWGMTTLWVITRAHVIQQIFPSFVYYAGAIGLFIGNFVFTYINVAGCIRRGHHDLVKYALLSPIYWALMSVGAWKGFLQLLYRPHYWEKTVHGLDVGFEPENVRRSSP